MYNLLFTYGCRQIILAYVTDAAINKLQKIDMWQQLPFNYLDNWL